MKKIIYSILIFCISLIVAVVIAANSSFVIKKAADTFAPDYNISYQKISGNIFTGVKIEGLSYAHQPLCHQIHFSWNPSKILYKHIAVNLLSVEEINVDTIKALIASFPESDDNSSSASFPLTVTVGKIHVTVNSFIQEGISVDRVALDMKELLYASDTVAVEDLKLSVDTNITKLKLQASLEKGKVTVDLLNMEKVDTEALQKILMPKEAGRTSKEKEDTVPDNEEEAGLHPLVPRKVLIKTLHTDLMPFEFDPVKVAVLDLDVYAVVFDVEKRLVEKGEVKLAGQTNISDFREEGTIVNNKLNAHVTVTPNQPLFKLYNIPLRREAIGDIRFDINASKEQVKVTLDAKAKQILKMQPDQTDTNTTKVFNVDIDVLKSDIVYGIESGMLTADTRVMLSTPYAKDINITNHFVMDQNISYSGEVQAGEIIGIDAKLVKPANDLHLFYAGDLDHVRTDMEAEGIKGYFLSEDLKKDGHFHLETKGPVALGEMVALPPELNASEVNIMIDVPLNFAKLVPIAGKAAIRSNLANVDADLSYGDTVTLKLRTEVPENSLLKNLDNNIQWSAITPLNTDIKMGKSDIALKLNAEKISADMLMKPYDGTVDGTIKLAGLRTTLKGESGGDILINSDIGSFKTLLETVNQFYTVKGLPKVDGRLSVSLIVNKNHEASLVLNSPQIIYHADRKTDHVIDNVNIMLTKKDSQIELSTYNLSYNKMLFYSSKPSIVTFDDETVTVSQLWLNDQLKVAGELNTKTMQGEILADAETFHFSHEMIDLDSKIGLKTAFNGENTDIQGKVILLGGDIHYDMGTKTFPSDSDIMIVQDMKDKEPSPFMDHLTMQVNVDTRKPLVYKEGDADIQANITLGIHKAVFSDPMIIGSIDLVDGGSYQFQGKKFVLERSHIYLTGDPSKPMLDITVKYKALRHLITINVTGTPAVPNVLFSSVPSLTKEQILSIILFDSEEGADTNNANDMMKMMGGAMAKSALNNLGVKLDHLVIGEGNSVEVGKKLTDDVTVIYINGDIPQMEVKYDYSPSIEVVVGASEQSESLDLVYRKDFNMGSDDDIVIKGREE